MKKIVLLFALIVGGGFSTIAQNNNALITPDGTSFPRKSLVSTTDVSIIPNPAVSQLVYNTNAAISGVGADGAGYYFWNGTNWKKLAVGPVSGGASSLPTTGIVLSETETNSPLSNAGYSLIGKVTSTFQQYTPTNPFYEWTSSVNQTSVPNGRVWQSTSLVNNKMMVFGGYNPSNFAPYYNTGGLLDLATNTWSPTSLTNAPSPRGLHTAITAGSKVIIWGGRFQSASADNFLSDGRIYDEPTNTWATISGTNAPLGRQDHTAIWTGSKMIIWGGNTAPVAGNLTNTGAIYDLATDSWTTMSTTNAPIGRYGHSAIWTGNKMIVWGGFPNNSSSVTNTGGIYDLATDSWTSISTANPPIARMNHLAIWSGSKMYIFGGTQYAGSGNMANGAIYDPSNDTWSVMTGGGGDGNLKGVYLGNDKIMVANGLGFSSMYVNIYNTNTDTWLGIPSNSYTPASNNRAHFSFVWNGTKGVVWGGNQQYGPPYDTSGGIIGLTSYQSIAETPFYLFKKN